MLITNCFLDDLVNLFYPTYCLLCKQSLSGDEKQLCINCLCNLPRTNYHISKGNPTRMLFAGYPQINEATSFLFFEKEGITQHLVHSLKYLGNKSLAVQLGRLAATELKNCGCFASVDTLIPVPLHPKKQRKRGYNQSEQIAIGFADVYGCNIDIKTLRRTANTRSQTSMATYERHINVEKIFTLTNSEILTGKHILLIDDVITTGATTSACLDVLITIPEIKISIFSLSIARDY